MSSMPEPLKWLIWIVVVIVIIVFAIWLIREMGVFAVLNAAFVTVPSIQYHGATALAG